MTLAGRLFAGTAVALACAALGAAAPATAADGIENRPPTSHRATPGAYVQKTSDCTTNSDGTQTCQRILTHEIEVSAHSGVIPATFGVQERVTTPTGTTTYHHIAHELNGSSGITEFNAHNVSTSEDGCKLISGIRIINGSRTDSSRTICPK